MVTARVFEELKEAILELDEEKVQKVANDLVAQGIDPVEGIEKGLSQGMTIIGDKFNRGEVYLPELIRASNTFNAAMKILEPEILKRGEERTRRGTVILGTVKGDIHKIGKDILAMLMKTRGFEVYNLGEDVSMSTFLKQAAEHSADIIGMSSLLTTTMPGQKEVIELLKETGVRDRYIVMVGGGPVSAEWAKEIGADGYAETAEEAVSLADELMSGKR
ncbi:MAG: corrinoid protein [Deltaproteobacteria bacterium]|nr:corrinoid protein [Deltaproteobacteria bacterium]